ncbi:unnamed protein product [Angiostrongylus costaricensis]|uniref:MFS domain-containing protein n=1 Tax=Angiostrongylus costaricensis TaxID=334426 RepID=A0A0R3PKQ2_ANGCS|nr:unnamed protein product [Angiostrongylus costaricensis]
MDERTKRLDDYISMGRYVILVCVLAELMILPQVSSMYYMMYAGASPSLSACGDDLIFDPELDEKEVCRLYQQVALENCSASSLRYEFKSVNVEWNYICENASIIKNSISVQMIGVLTGSVVFGQLSDLYGRRKGMLGTMTGMAVSLLLVAKSATLVQFTVTRTIVGFFTGGSIAIWIRESPQWLLQRGRVNEAIEIMRGEFNCFKETDMNDVIEKEYYFPFIFEQLLGGMEMRSDFIARRGEANWQKL